MALALVLLFYGGLIGRTTIIMRLPNHLIICSVTLLYFLSTIGDHEFLGLPIKKLLGIVAIASLIGALLPMGMTLLFGLSQPTILAFASRSVTTPLD